MNWIELKLIKKNSPWIGSSMFSLLLSEWFLWGMGYDRIKPNPKITSLWFDPVTQTHQASALPTELNPPQVLKIHCSHVHFLNSWCNGSSDWSLMVDPLSYFSLLHKLVYQRLCMCYHVCGMVHIKEPLLLIEKSSPLSEDSWFVLWDVLYNISNAINKSVNKNVLSVLLNNNFLPSLHFF